MIDLPGDASQNNFKVGDICMTSKSRYHTISGQEVRVDGFTGDKVQVTLRTGPKKGKPHQFKWKDLELKERQGRWGR